QGKELIFQGAQGKTDQGSKFFHDEKPLLSVVWRLTLSEVWLLVPFLTSPSCPRAMEPRVTHPRLAYPWEPSIPLELPQKHCLTPGARTELTRPPGMPYNKIRTLSGPEWRNGRLRGLKILWVYHPCGFESRLRHH